MRYKKWIPVGIMALCTLAIAACDPSFQTGLTATQEQPAESGRPTPTHPGIQTPESTDDVLPTMTPKSTTTTVPSPTSTPDPTPSQTIASGLVKRLCPHLQPPLGLFSAAAPIYDSSTDPATLYVPYQITELSLEDPPQSCTLYLAPGPMGAPQFGGDSLFWKSFDHGTKTVTIWGYDPLPEISDEAYPHHIPFGQTTFDTPMEKSGLVEFVASFDGDMLAWSYTDPVVNDDNEYAYVQVIYAGAPNDPIDQRPILEVWFDVVPEAGGRPHIIRLRLISADKDRIYYSDEPVGLGRQWPEPLGQYSSLYSISSWGDSYPELHYDCGSAHWCISDFSEELDLLVSIQENPYVVQVSRLSSGETIGRIPAAGKYNFLRQARIGPDGAIAYLGVALDDSVYDAPPADVAVFYIEPPYTGLPVLVVKEPGLLNLLGWVSPGRFLGDGNPLDEDNPVVGGIPTRLMMVDITSGVGEWLPMDAKGYIDLIP